MPSFFSEVAHMPVLSGLPVGFGCGAGLLPQSASEAVRRPAVAS